MPGVRVRPNPLLEAGQDLGDRLAGLHDHVSEQEADQDTVALGDVSAHGEPTRLLAAQQRVRLHHLGRDVLESDRDLVDALAKLSAQFVHHRGHVHRLDDRASLAARLEEVEHEQREHLQLVDEAASLVDDANAVRVAVGADAEVLASDLHESHRGVDVRRDRLGVQTAEERVALVVQLGHRRTPAADHFGDVAIAGAVHALVHDAQPGVLDRVEVDHACDLRVVRRPGIVGAHQPDRHPVIGSRHVVERVDVAFELGDHLRRHGAAGLSLVLVAVELVGVVTGCDRDRSGRLAVDDGP